MNLAPDKDGVFAQVWRVLAPGGRLAIADLATLAPLPAALRDGLGTWAACIAGALSGGGVSIVTLTVWLLVVLGGGAAGALRPVDRYPLPP